MSYFQKSNRRAESGNPVSLFPFLAVLLCTMGALIAVLLLIARQAQLSTDEFIQQFFAAETAEQSDGPQNEKESGAELAKADEETEDEFTLDVPDDLNEKLTDEHSDELSATETELSEELGEEEPEGLAQLSMEELEKHLAEIKSQDEQEKWRLEELRNVREKSEKEARDARIALSTTQENRDRLMREMETFREALLNVSRSQEEKDPELMKKEIAEKERALEELKKQLEKAENSASRQNGSYAILPHTGPDGTRRYPIYIECRGDGAWLMPENVRLTQADFQGKLSMENPLEMALIAKRQYLLKNGVFQETYENEQEPYPLIIVRPGGILYLYLVRASLQSWKSEFGYELVEAEIPIAYPPNDENLKNEVVRAIQIARQRQYEIARMAPTLSHASSGKGTLAFHPTSQGAVPVHISPDSRLGETLAASSGAGKRNGAAPGMGAGGMQTGGTGPNGMGPRMGPNGMASGGSGMNGAGAGSLGPGGTEVSGAAVPGTAQTHSAYGSDGNSALENSHAGSGGMPPGHSGNSGGQLSNASNSSGAAGQVGAAQGGTSGGPTGNAFSNELARARQGETANSQTSSVPAAVSANDFSQWSTVSPSPDGGIPGAGGDSASPTGSAGGPGENSSACVAATEGQNWALQNYRANLSSLTRPVAVECGTDTLVLSGTPGLPSVKIPVTTPVQTAKKLASELGKQMRGWGEPGRGMYWKPILRVRVADGAEAQFEMLQRMLQGSGLEVEEVK